jgi:hypothetical protein
MRRDAARRIAAVSLLSALSFTLVACPSSRDQDTEENENENESPEDEKVNKAENPREEESENEKPENEKEDSGNAEP